MIWVALIVAYAVVYMVVWRRVFYAIACPERWRGARPLNWWDVGGAAVDAMVVCLVWPVVVVGWVVKRRTGGPMGFVSTFGREPKAARIHRLETEAAVRERRVRDLERELGL